MMDDNFDFSDFEEHVPKHADFDAEKPEIDHHKRVLPCKVDDLDLQQPPGFVGRVADWVDSQCRYPRRRLAVASSIVAIGNIAGLRYRDAHGDISPNMIAFCVAASSTGKEAVMQAFNELHRAAGVAGAIHGSIKSEQEIMRNAIDQQASYYSIDEIGIFLTKVRKAQRGNSGASYLEGVFGAIMSLYSKANSFMPLGGDTARDLRKSLTAGLSRAEENGDEKAIAIYRRKLDTLDRGLERPFMSLVGYTTPSTFDGIMDGETATQGLVGRAIIVNEPDINPSPRLGFSKPAMPMVMSMKLFALSGRDVDDIGPVDMTGTEREPIETDPAAAKLLDEILLWLIEYGHDAAEETGEASVAMVRRCYEQVAKVSFILGVGDGVRTVDHVRWAFAYCKAELDAKVALVFANDNAKSNPQEALAARIMGRLDHEKGKSVAVLANQLKVDRSSIEPILHNLKEKGLCDEKIGKRLYRGQKVASWFLSG